MYKRGEWNHLNEFDLFDIRQKKERTTAPIYIIYFILSNYVLYLGVC